MPEAVAEKMQFFERYAVSGIPQREKMSPILCSEPRTAKAAK